MKTMCLPFTPLTMEIDPPTRGGNQYVQWMTEKILNGEAVYSHQRQAWVAGMSVIPGHLIPSCRKYI